EGSGEDQRDQQPSATPPAHAETTHHVALLDGCEVRLCVSCAGTEPAIPSARARSATRMAGQPRGGDQVYPRRGRVPKALGQPAHSSERGRHGKRTAIDDEVCEDQDELEDLEGHATLGLARRYREDVARPPSA